MSDKLIKILDGNSQNLPSTGSEQLKAGRFFITTDFPNEAIYYCPEDGRIIQLGGGVGKRTVEGGEIFNDYVNNKALSQFSTAEGYHTVASNYGAHAGGIWTIANGEGQTAIGIYNDNKTDTLFEVGNGTGEKRSNAFEVYKDGHAEAQTQGQTDNSVVIKSYVDNKFTQLSNEFNDLGTQVFLELESPKNSIKFTDTFTKTIYKLYVTNGKLQLEVVE